MDCSSFKKARPVWPVVPGYFTVKSLLWMVRVTPVWEQFFLGRWTCACTGSVSITWVFVRNAHSELPHPRPAESETLPDSPAIWVLTSPPGALLTRKLEEHCFLGGKERSCQRLRRLRECRNLREAKESRQARQKYKPRWISHLHTETYNSLSVGESMKNKNLIRATTHTYRGLIRPQLCTLHRFHLLQKQPYRATASRVKKVTRNEIPNRLNNSPFSVDLASHGTNSVRQSDSAQLRAVFHRTSSCTVALIASVKTSPFSIHFSIKILSFP